MSEANPNGHGETNELNELIRDLESQIESVNAGLIRIRGTVARLSYLSQMAPAPSMAWNGGPAAAPASQQWSPSPSPAVEVAPSPQVAAPMPFGFDTAAHPHETPAGFWDSVAEGASWPRAQHAEAPSVPPAEEVASPAAPESLTPDVSVPSQPDAPALETMDVQVPDASLPEEPATAEEPQQSDAEPQPVEAFSEDVQAWMNEASVQSAETDQHEPDAVETPSSEGEPAVPAAGAEMPPTLSSGWPDESAWSQSFVWPAMKQEVVADAEPQPADAPVDVSDIVAQVKAELEAARAQGLELPLDDDTYDTHDTPALEETTSAPELDDDARREEVSRAVAEMRAQIEAGHFEDVARESGLVAEGFGAWTEAAASPEQPEDDVRDAVRRAVEATRDELASAGSAESERSEKPAFRLAAPGSIPDWSHMQVEPSGPPVVVIKDADGRVELASVYETLNELGCGEGAALLNYTPHSVTVGLPISARFPSKESVAGAVEKVFGLTSRVESDGVRITVSIGVDPKRRSVDAA